MKSMRELRQFFFQNARQRSSISRRAPRNWLIGLYCSLIRLLHQQRFESWHYEAGERKPNPASIIEWLVVNSMYFWSRKCLPSGLVLMVWLRRPLTLGDDAFTMAVVSGAESVQGPKCWSTKASSILSCWLKNGTVYHLYLPRLLVLGYQSLLTSWSFLSHELMLKTFQMPIIPRQSFFLELLKLMCTIIKCYILRNVCDILRSSALPFLSIFESIKYICQKKKIRAPPFSNLSSFFFLFRRSPFPFDKGLYYQRITLNWSYLPAKLF